MIHNRWDLEWCTESQRGRINSKMGDVAFWLANVITRGPGGDPTIIWPRFVID